MLESTSSLCVERERGGGGGEDQIKERKQKLEVKRDGEAAPERLLTLDRTLINTAPLV